MPRGDKDRHLVLIPSRVGSDRLVVEKSMLNGDNFCHSQALKTPAQASSIGQRIPSRVGSKKLLMAVVWVGPCYALGACRGKQAKPPRARQASHKLWTRYQSKPNKGLEKNRKSLDTEPDSG